MNKIISWTILALILGQSLVCAGEIHIATGADKLDRVKSLIESNRANLEAKDKWGETPLIIAIKLELLTMVQELIKMGARVDDSALGFADISKNSNIQAEVLRARMNQDAKDFLLQKQKKQDEPVGPNNE